MPDNQEQEIVEYRSQFNGEFMDQAFQKVLNPDSKPTKNSTNLIISKALYDCLPKLVNVTLSDTWTGDGPFTQTVTIENQTITSKTKVDVWLTVEQMISLQQEEITAIVIENINGVLTAYSIGGYPIEAITIRCIIYEVL